MPTFSWNDALSLDLPERETAGHELVGLLGELQHALAVGSDTDVGTALARLTTRAEERFGLEERWMALLGDEADPGHAYQHQAVLNVLHEVQRLYAGEHDRDLPRRLVAGLALWFPGHIQTMDAAMEAALAGRHLALTRLQEDGAMSVTLPGALVTWP